MSQEKSTGDQTTGNTALGGLRALATENAAEVQRLRGTQIPQHVGMAGAARALAADLPRVLISELEGDLKSGALETRLEAARCRAADPTQGVRVDPMLAAVVMLMSEQAKGVARYLAVRGEEWASDAYRLDGQAAALEAQLSHLLRIVHSAGAPDSPAAALEPESVER